jgi:hypothetical protein
VGVLHSAEIRYVKEPHPSGRKSGFFDFICDRKHISRQRQRVTTRDTRARRRKLVHQDRLFRLRYVHHAETRDLPYVGYVKQALAVGKMLKSHSLAPITMAIQ